jgi:hypothetical protein
MVSQDPLLPAEFKGALKDAVVTGGGQVVKVAPEVVGSCWSCW